MRKSVAVDAAFLKAFLNPRSRPAPVTHLIKALSSESAKVIIPTPALAEVLTRMPEAAQTYLQEINRSACFQIRPFDDKASIELTELLQETAPGFRDILRFDRQIVAIARVYGASMIYADDQKIVDFATECGMPAKRLKDLN